MRNNNSIKRIFAMLLVLVMVLGMVPAHAHAATEKTSADSSFIRVFHLDAGRKYFAVEQVKEIVDAISAVGYTHLELVFGNEGLRFLMDDMSITVGNTTYSSEAVSAGIKAGNVSYSHAGEWSQTEMDEMIAYAKTKGIGIIPMVNSPGHMNAILAAAEHVGISSPKYSAKVSNGWWGSSSVTSKTTISLSNTAAVAFTKELVKKYAEYFAARGSEYFNLGADEYAADVHSSGSMGFGVMQSGGWYDDFVNYVNDIASIIKTTGMKPIAFNDGIYFNENDDTAFDRDIIVAYWIPAWGTYYVASPAYLISKGHKILNTNDDWYYVLGRNGENDGYGYYNAYNGVNNTPVTKVADGTTLSVDKLIGSMNCVWCDEPDADYESNKSNVMYFINTLAEKNSTYFVVNELPEHTYNSVVVAPTCTDGGYTVHTCVDCGESYTDSYTEARGHEYKAIVTDATCTEGGYTTYMCANCGDSYVADETAAQGHDYKSVTVEATCSTDGSVTYTCACGDTYTQVIPATGEHVYESVTVEATCSTDGSVTYTCACGDTYTQVIPATGEHVYESVTVEATCSTDGSVTYTCVCGDTYTQVIPAAGHSYKAVVTAPTCTEGGYTTYTCTCGDSYIADEVAALGHNYKAVVTAPTCTEGGYTTYTCTCGDSYIADEVAALGHNYKAVVTAPTCTEDGYTIYTCTCGDSYAADEVAALGHNYKAVVTAPTCTEGGYTTYTCTCGDSYAADEVAALGHNYKAVVTAPTCTEDGYTTYTCACGDSYVVDKITALGHKYTAAEVDGYLIHTCGNCGDSYSESIGWVAVPGTYVLDTDGIDVGEAYKYIIVGVDRNYALTLSNGTIGAAAVTVNGDTVMLDDASAFEFYFVDNNNVEKGSYLLTKDGTKSVYHMGGNIYYGADNKGYWHIGANSNGSYQLYDYDNRNWYLNYGYVWGSDSVSRFAVSSNARYVRLFRAEDSYVRLSGETVQAWTHGPEITESAVLEQIMIQTSTDGSNISGTVAVTADMVVWDKNFDGYTAGTYTGEVIWNGTVVGTVTVTVIGEHMCETVVMAPTCTEGGCTVHTCTVCGLSTQSDITDALGHSYTAAEVNGYMVYTCGNCGDSYSEKIAPNVTYNRVNAISSGERYVITLYSGGKYYALSHSGNRISAVQVAVSNGQVTSEITGDLLWNYKSGKLSYESNGTTYYLYAGSSNDWWGGWWGSTTLSISTSNSSTVSFSGSKLKVGSNYLRYSNGSISVNRSATTTYIFEETEE